MTSPPGSLQPPGEPSARLARGVLQPLDCVSNWVGSVRRILQAEDGSSAVEYALILAVICSAIVLAGFALRSSLEGSLNGSAATIQTATADDGSAGSSGAAPGNAAGNGNAGGNGNRNAGGSGNGNAGGNGNGNAGGNGNGNAGGNGNGNAGGNGKGNGHN